MRSTPCCGSPAHRYGRIERFAGFQNPEAQHQQLAHRCHDNLLGIKAAPGLQPGHQRDDRPQDLGRSRLLADRREREGEQVHQQVIATLGRFDELQKSGQLERLLRSGARFSATPGAERSGIRHKIRPPPQQYGAALAPQAYRRHCPHQLAT
jgi:hypothetical protein